MRIDWLKLPKFRNLVDFAVDFDQDSSRQVIVGRNGVGKSNLLEAVTRIFRDLDLEVTTTFPYEIQYFCHDRLVRIKNEIKHRDNPSKQGAFTRSYEVCGDASKDLVGSFKFERIAEAEFFKRNRSNAINSAGERLLPNYVFGYYSGTLSRFEAIFQRHEEQYYSEQISGREAPLRSLFLAKPRHSQFALLAFFAVDDLEAREFLRNEMRIESFDSLLFKLREPYWAKGQRQNRRSISDKRFWGAAGKVAPFLTSLFENSFFPMAFSERLKVSVGQTATKERRYCFVRDIAGLKNLAAGLSNKEFFARLESLVFSNLVAEDGSDVRVWLRLAGVENPTTFDDLAEGERQLLTVLGLLRFTAEDEALFIMDEPDTHLNPAWCLDYLENLKRYGADLKTSQIIMTTHNPLTFAGLKKNEVVILEREANAHIFAQHPIRSPRGMGFSAILTSDYFGLRSGLDRRTLRLLDKKRSLALKEDKTDLDRAQLARLDRVLGRLDFSKAARDPLYLEFIRAMTQAQEENPEISDAVPRKEDWRVRKEIAEDIAKRLGGESEK
jgi:predicted ATPase